MDGKLRNMVSLYLSKGSRMLLLYRQGSRVVNNVWISSAGGHLEEYELNNARACVLRELTEELGLTESQIENLSLKYITIRRTPDEIRQNYYFFAELKEDVEENLTSNEGISKWFDFAELPELEMPFTAKYVIEHYLEKGKQDNNVYGGIADGEKVIFVNLPEF